MQYTHCIRPPWSGADGPPVPGVTVKVLPAAVLPAIDGAPELTGVGCRSPRYSGQRARQSGDREGDEVPKLRMRIEVMRERGRGEPLTGRGAPVGMAQPRPGRIRP